MAARSIDIYSETSLLLKSLFVLPAEVAVMTVNTLPRQSVHGHFWLRRITNSTENMPDLVNPQAPYFPKKMLKEAGYSTAHFGLKMAFVNLPLLKMQPSSLGVWITMSMGALIYRATYIKCRPIHTYI